MPAIAPFVIVLVVLSRIACTDFDFITTSLSKRLQRIASGGYIIGQMSPNEDYKRPRQQRPHDSDAAQTGLMRSGLKSPYPSNAPHSLEKWALALTAKRKAM